MTVVCLISLNININLNTLVINIDEQITLQKTYMQYIMTDLKEFCSPLSIDIKSKPQADYNKTDSKQLFTERTYPSIADANKFQYSIQKPYGDFTTNNAFQSPYSWKQSQFGLDNRFTKSVSQQISYNDTTNSISPIIGNYTDRTYRGPNEKITAFDIPSLSYKDTLSSQYNTLNKGVNNVLLNQSLTNKYQPNYALTIKTTYQPLLAIAQYNNQQHTTSIKQNEQQQTIFPKQFYSSYQQQQQQPHPSPPQHDLSFNTQNQHPYINKANANNEKYSMIEEIERPIFEKLSVENNDDKRLSGNGRESLSGDRFGDAILWMPLLILGVMLVLLGMLCGMGVICKGGAVLGQNKVDITSDPSLPSSPVQPVPMINSLPPVDTTNPTATSINASQQLAGSTIISGAQPIEAPLLQLTLPSLPDEGYIVMTSQEVVVKSGKYDNNNNNNIDIKQNNKDADVSPHVVLEAPASTEKDTTDTDIDIYPQILPITEPTLSQLPIQQQSNTAATLTYIEPALNYIDPQVVSPIPLAKTSSIQSTETQTNQPLFFTQPQTIKQQLVGSNSDQLNIESMTSPSISVTPQLASNSVQQSSQQPQPSSLMLNAQSLHAPPIDPSNVIFPAKSSITNQT